MSLDGTVDVGASSASVERTHALHLHDPSAVLQTAPWWAYATSWHCKHPDSTAENSYIKVMGPHSSDEVR